MRECQKIRHLLALRPADRSADEQKLVEAHLPACPACTALVREYAEQDRLIRGLPNAGIFLLAYWFDIDGVDTIIRMAVDYGMSLGFDSGDLILALLIVQFVGFPAALGFGILFATFILMLIVPALTTNFISVSSINVSSVLSMPVKSITPLAPGSSLSNSGNVNRS